VDVEVKSTRERQTYYGALDYLTKILSSMSIVPVMRDKRVAFLKYLQSFMTSLPIVIIWDGYRLPSFCRSSGVSDSDEWSVILEQ